MSGFDKDVITDMGSACLLMRSRLISRVITDIYDEQLRPLEISSSQFALLVAIYRVQPATRADIARDQHLDRSTLTRHLKAILSQGWAEEIREEADGRSRPIVLTMAGKDLLRNAVPGWRAAQAQAKILLEKNDVIAIANIANYIMDHPTPDSNTT